MLNPLEEAIGAQLQGEGFSGTQVNRAYRTARRTERREAAGAAVRLGQVHQAYIDNANAMGCDPDALRVDHGTLVGLVGTTHVGRMRQLKRIHRRVAENFPAPSRG